MLTTLPLPKTSAATYGQVSLEPWVPSVGKKNPERTTSTMPPTPALWSLSKSPYFDPNHGDCKGIFLVNHWESDCDRDERKGLQQQAYRSWQIEFILAEPK